MNFEFATRTTIVFGAGVLARLGEHAARLGTRAWLVTGSRALERAGVVERAVGILATHGVRALRQTVAGEPDVRAVDEGARAAREAGCDLVVGLGGGSALDTAKAVACLLVNGGEALDYLEVVGRGLPVRQPPAPWIAVPTTAGTGSEVTRNAVLADPGTGTKASLRHPSLVATVALLDPTVTHSLPPDVTARTGLDALIQLIEPYVSRRAHPMIDPLALDGIRRAAVALPRAYADGGDAAAREDLLLAALLSGIALAHCGLGISHAFAGPLGGSYPVPHGLACAATLPSGMAANLSAAARAAPDVPGPGGAETVRRYADVARALGAPAAENELATARAGVDHVRSLCRRLAIPPLGAFGVTRRAIPDLVARARLTSSMKANPVELDDAAMADVLAQAIG